VVSAVGRRSAAVTLSVLAATCGGARNGPPTAPSPTPSAGQVWADEFDGPSNSPPDPAKWTYDLGNNGGWGNQELETYTSLPDNARLDGLGHLIIRAERSGAGFTSARLKTQGRFSAQYGRVEARIKVPFGQGIWPAFWMLGASFTGSNWPQCGEIDIMENVGREPSVVHGTVHGPGYSGERGITAAYALPGSERLADDFHVFAILWAPGTITWTVDGRAYQTVTPASLPGNAPWVFDNPFFLLLNVAVGGLFPGAPDASSTFPQEMMVDYVRVSGAASREVRSTTLLQAPAAIVTKRRRSVRLRRRRSATVARAERRTRAVGFSLQKESQP
jgi:beta-glucanase (GH16 family)